MDIHYSILVHICSNGAGQQREQKLINLFLEQGWESSMLCQTRKEMKGTPYCLSHLKRKMWCRKRNSMTCFWLGFFFCCCCCCFKADENSKHTNKYLELIFCKSTQISVRQKNAPLAGTAKYFLKLPSMTLIYCL